LKDLIFRGGGLWDLLRQEEDQSFSSESVQLTIDLRRATDEDLTGMSDAGWPRDMGQEGMWDVPLCQICFRTSSSDLRTYVEDDLDDTVENLANDVADNVKLSGTRVDETGRTFRQRIEVTLEDDEPEWDEEDAELDFCRATGKSRWPHDRDQGWSDSGGRGCERIRGLIL
jgi:hypothetical protein